VKTFWNNLRPLEKRLVVGVAAMLFVILNAWFVVPHFSDWGRVQRRTQQAINTLNLFETTVRQVPALEQQVKRLESEGLAVPQEEQAIHFSTTIQSQAAQTGVAIQSTSRISTRTNQFFVEVSQTIVVQSKEQQLVDFLYNLGSGNSLTRVRDLTLHPDQSHQQLSANVKLVASYQKKSVGRAAAAAAPAPAPKPAAAPARPVTPVRESAQPPAKTTPPPPAKTSVPPARPAAPNNKPAANKPNTL